MRLETALVSAVATIALGACGGGNAPGVSGSKTSAATDCPPEQKGNGVMVSSRYDYEDLIEANKWRTEMFPAACAGSLAALVPDLPSGFGVKPTHKPYVMNDEQVYVAYARLVEPLYLDEETANVPIDVETIEYEIVRFTDEERTTLADWMTANPDSYLSGSVAGHDVYLIGGFGSGRPGKGDRLATSLHALLDDNIVVRISHKDLFSQRAGLDVPPLVETVLKDIIAGSGAG
ncbi:MAG: hypothetical protein ACE37M_02685 [Henriciella sp.]